jgi:hypothetical protein
MADEVIETTNPKLIEAARQRYSDAEQELAQCGFTYLGCYDDVEHRFGLITKYSLVKRMKAKGAIVRYLFPLGFSTTNPAYANSSSHAYAYALGLGVVFYTFFKDKVTIVTASFGPPSLNKEIPNLYYKFRVPGSIGDAWNFHKSTVEQLIADGREPWMPMTMNHFLMVERIDTKLMQL